MYAQPSKTQHTTYRTCVYEHKTQTVLPIILYMFNYCIEWLNNSLNVSFLVSTEPNQFLVRWSVLFINFYVSFYFVLQTAEKWWRRRHEKKTTIETLPFEWARMCNSSHDMPSYFCVLASLMEDTDSGIARHNNINTIVAIITIIIITIIHHCWEWVHVIRIYGAWNGFIILKTSKFLATCNHFHTHSLAHYFGVPER